MEGGLKFDEPQRVAISLDSNRFIYKEVKNIGLEIDIRNPESLYEMTMVAGSFIKSSATKPPCFSWGM